MEPLSLVVWAVFLYSLSMFPLGIMLGSTCCHCDNRVECFSPTHRCFRTLRTYPDGRKTASSTVDYVHFGHSYLNGLSYSTPSVSYGTSANPRLPYSAGVFSSHESFQFQYSFRVRYAHQLSRDESATITPALAVRGNAHLVSGQCTIGPIITAPVSLAKSPSIVMHGWDFPLLDYTSEIWLDYVSTTGGARFYQSNLREWKKYAAWSRHAVVSHAVVGLELIGDGVAAAATAEQIRSLLQIQVDADGSYAYSATIPAGMFDYTAGYGAVKWTVRVSHGTAFHDEIVGADVWSLAAPDPSAPAPPLLTSGVHIQPPSASNEAPPTSYFDEVTGTLHVWPATRSDVEVEHGPFTFAGSQSQLVVVQSITATSYTVSPNPMGWTTNSSGKIINPSSTVAVVTEIQGSVTFPQGAYFHRPIANLFDMTPCYTRDTSAVAAYMAGEAGLVYSVVQYGEQRDEEYRLDADNPLCGLPLTHLPASLLPESVTVTRTDGEPLYETVCDDCPSTVSMKRTNNEVYFYPAADIHNTGSGRNRTYAGGNTWYYYYGYLGDHAATPFAISLAEVVGHTDAVAYLDSFYADTVDVSLWLSTADTSVAVTAEIGGEDFPEGFDTPLVKHVTEHEATPRTIAVHGHKGVYPHSSYKVEVEISDVEVVTAWEDTSYAQDYDVNRYWVVNGRVTTEPSPGWPSYDQLDYITGSYPNQPQFDLPNDKKDEIIDAIKALDPFVDEAFLSDSGQYNFYSPSQTIAISWRYDGADGGQTLYRRLKCDGTFLTEPSIGRTPGLTLSEPPPQPSGGGHIYRFSSAWGSTQYYLWTTGHPNHINLIDNIPDPPEEIPAESRSFPYINYSGAYGSTFVLPTLVVPLPPNDEDTYEIAFYQCLSTLTSDSDPPKEPYTLQWINWNPPQPTVNGQVTVPGSPLQSQGIYLLKITLSVAVTKGDPPADSCGISVAVGKPETSVDEPLSKEDVTFTFSTDCTLPSTFRGHVWPHAGVPHSYYWNYYWNQWGTFLTGKQDGHVLHLTNNDPDGTVDDPADQATGRTPYYTHPFSPVNVGETLYPYADSTSFRPAIREGEWQGHIYVQGEQHDDLTYAYQFTSMPYVDRCETNKANWKNMLGRSTLRQWIEAPYGDDTLAGTRSVQSRDAEFTVVGYFAPEEKVRIGYISHKQYGVPSSYAGTETYPESGWYSASRYAQTFFYYYIDDTNRLFPPGMMAVAGEATCDADGKFTYTFSSTSVSGDLSLYFQPVNPQTGRGLLEYVRSKASLDDCKERWDGIASVYVVRSIPQPVLSPIASWYGGSPPLSEHAVSGGYVVRPSAAVNLELSSVVKESSVATGFRLINAATGQVFLDHGPGYFGDGAFATGIVSPAQMQVVFSGKAKHGDVIQIAAIVFDDLGNESPPATLSGLIRLDGVAPAVTGLAVNGIPADGTVILNDVSTQSPVVVSGFTEPGCKVSIGTSAETAGDTVTSAGTVTVSSVTGDGAFALSTQVFSSLSLGDAMGRTLFVTDVAKNFTQRSVSVWNRLPVVVSATISGGSLECKLNYVQKNATASFTFLRSDGASSPVLTPAIEGETGEVIATFVDTGFSVDFTYGVQISVVLPNGQSVFSEQRNVVPA